jgi:YHS domain-containing protein
MHKRFRVALVSILALTGATLSVAMKATPAAADAFGGDPYPLDTCPVSGEKLGADAVNTVLSGMKDKNLDGTQVKFCCAKCEASFKADPAKYLAKMDEAIAKAAAAYPLSNCLVMTDEKIEDDAKTVVYQNRVYKLCCKKCVARFSKDPAKYAKEYEAAVIAAQKPGYKATTCPISGKPLGDGAVDIVVNGRLVRACCNGCVGPIKADPKAAFAKIDAAK